MPALPCHQGRIVAGIDIAKRAVGGVQLANEDRCKIFRCARLMQLHRHFSHHFAEVELGVVIENPKRRQNICHQQGGSKAFAGNIRDYEYKGSIVAKGNIKQVAANRP